MHTDLSSIFRGASIGDFRWCESLHVVVRSPAPSPGPCTGTLGTAAAGEERRGLTLVSGACVEGGSRGRWRRASAHWVGLPLAEKEMRSGIKQEPPEKRELAVESEREKPKSRPKKTTSAVSGHLPCFARRALPCRPAVLAACRTRRSPFPVSAQCPCNRGHARARHGHSGSVWDPGRWPSGAQASRPNAG